MGTHILMGIHCPDLLISSFKYKDNVYLGVSDLLITIEKARISIDEVISKLNKETPTLVCPYP